jgi:phospholipid/cholesterol/gamma-HCH transport system ATP-binding protein
MGVLVKLIKSLNEAVGVTSIIVSHDVPETCSIADYVYVISNGRVIGQGTPAEVMDSPSAEVRQFMRGEPDGPVPFHYPAPTLSEDLRHG